MLNKDLVVIFFKKMIENLIIVDHRLIELVDCIIGSLLSPKKPSSLYIFSLLTYRLIRTVNNMEAEK